MFTRLIWNRKHVMLLLGTLEMYLSSGFTVHQSLYSIRDVLPKRCRNDIQRITLSIERGFSLSEAFKKYIYLSPALSALIRQGEYSGNLAQATQISYSILQREDALLKTIISSLVYPFIIGICAIVIMIGLMRGVMPQVSPLLKSLNVTLPLTTQFCMYLSDHLTYLGVLIFITLCVVSGLYLLMYRTSVKCRRISHTILLALPLFGSIVRLYVYTILFRIIGGYISAGGVVLVAYIQSVDSISNIPIRTYLSDRTDDIRKGVRLSVIFSGLRHIPHYALPFIAAGESSGTLGATIVKTADYIEQDIAHSLKRITAFIEPFMMITIGIGVGLVAISIMMPIYDISKALQQ